MESNEVVSAPKIKIIACKNADAPEGKKWHPEWACISYTFWEGLAAHVPLRLHFCIYFTEASLLHWGILSIFFCYFRSGFRDKLAKYYAEIF